MSQFLIITGPAKPSIKISGVSVIDINSAQPLIQEVIEYYGLPIEKTWLVCDSGSDAIDNLFSEASYQLSSGDGLGKTKLGVVLGALIINYGLVAWYGSEYEDLDLVENPFLLYELLDNQLSEGSGEIYVKYHS